MSPLFAAVVGVIALGAIVFVLLEFVNELRTTVGFHDRGPNAATSGNLKSLVQAQRNQSDSSSRSRKRGVYDPANLALAAAAETDHRRRKSDTHSRLTLAKKLRYAKSPLSPLAFRLIQSIATLLFFIPAHLHATVFIQILVLVLTPLLVAGMLDFTVERRFRAFDKDYPVMLLQLVSILKTGIGVITALEAVSKGLDHGSLVRSEIELFIDRLRLGLNEEQAISAFGEDIPHPELELFVQSLLIHRRVGGVLSPTLERLSKQVRKRQQFRDQAIAAVAMERTSIYAIAVVLTGLMFYMIIQSPELVLPAFSDKLGIAIFQGGLSLIIFGFYWSKMVTKIKV